MLALWKPVMVNGVQVPLPGLGSIDWNPGHAGFEEASFGMGSSFHNLATQSMACPVDTII